MARFIIRYSMKSGGDGNKVRKAIRFGFDHIDDAAAVDRSRTGTVEGEGDVPDIVNALQASLAKLADADPDTLDHLWIYIDRPPEPQDDAE